jgi:alkylated DNA repair dioxygenase AlkB
VRQYPEIVKEGYIVEHASFGIPGLQYVSGYVAPDEQAQLLSVVDAQPWLADLKRRVQHYGYRYDYKSRSVDSSTFLGALPAWAQSMAERIRHDGFTSRVPDQLIVNEYKPGQGIASHIDCLPCFGDTILSISLGSPCVMMFSSIRDEREVSILLEPGSLVVMRGDARHIWKHGIMPRKTDAYGGRTIQRGRRVSLTFRNVIR